MKQLHKTISISNHPYITQYFSESCAFFDIETTGFSPKNSFVYLIGLALREKDTLHIYQFLSENREEEALILSTFHQKLSSIDTLITFNGLGFDIPFLKSREATYSLSYNWNTYQNIDLYKITKKLSHLFHLPNQKQKSVELFLGIDRKDLYTGGELITKYYEYESYADSQTEDLLLLHNYEDVLGMTKLLPLLSYYDLFTKPIQLSEKELLNYRPFHTQEDAYELILTLETSLPFPKPILYQGPICTLKCENHFAKIAIKTYQGELKFYFENPKDYYYLPNEDIAIHKSIAAFVDSAHKKKATSATCYTKKDSHFLPQIENLFSPCFSLERNSSICYFELTEAFLSNQASLSLYASHLLKSCI